MKSILLILLLTLIVSACTEDYEKSNVQIVKYWLSDCDIHSNPNKLLTRIIEKRVSNDTLFLSLGFRRNCAYKIDPVLILRNDSMFIKNKPRGTRTRLENCNCCFELNFIVKGIRDTSFVTMFYSEPVYLCGEKYKTYPETFEIIDGDTVNRKNSYGLREGLWIDKDSSTGMIERRAYYIIDKERHMSDEYWFEIYSDGKFIERRF